MDSYSLPSYLLAPIYYRSFIAYLLALQGVTQGVTPPYSWGYYALLVFHSF